MNTSPILHVKHSQLATVDNNNGFIIPIFCIPYADFEVEEDRLGFVCLCVPR